MSVAVQEVMVVAQMTDRERDPICGFCMVGRKLKPRLRRQRDGGWRCPVCQAVTYHPSDADARDLEVMFAEGVARRRDEALEREYLSKPRVFMRGPVELKGTSKSGRRRKPARKLDPPPAYTLA